MTQPFKTQSTSNYRSAFKTNPLYARIYFGARLRFDLTLTEATLCDIITILSRKTGWCFASRAYMGVILGVSERSVRRMITRLESLHLVERNHKNPRQVRAAMLWIAECQADDKSGP